MKEQTSMNRSRTTLSCLLFVILLFCQTTVAKGETVRPKIGLALGGGSAGGFAHIGVLSWLEEHRIPVDYLAGTSMGGLMGGCYATGMSPSEIRALVESIRWNELFNPNPPYHMLDFRRKEDLRDFPIFEIGYRNHKVRLPSGLGVYRVDLILSRIASHYPASLNFDQLPIPFKTVATDIQNYQPVVFENGSLKDALRATMAIPGVFSPVIQNGRILVDGGVLNNVPVEIVKEMGADVVIAVNIDAPADTQEHETLDTVISKTIDTVVAHNVIHSLSQANVVITPSLKGLGLLQWDAAARYIELGYQAANQAGEALLKYALSPEEWEKYLSHRQALRKTENPIPAALRVEGASPFNALTIQTELATVIGVPFNPDVLEEQLTRIMGSGLYESLSYEFTKEADITTLWIKVREKTYGPPFIRFGVDSEIAALHSSNHQLNVGSRMTWLNPVGIGSELRLDLKLGTESALKLELYQPVSTSHWFVSPAIFGINENYSQFKGGARISDYRVFESGLLLDLGYAADKNSEFRFGYMIGYQKIRTKVGENLWDPFTGTLESVRMNWTYQSGDSPTFPAKNTYFNISAEHYLKAPGSDADFQLAQIKYRTNLPLEEHKSILANFEAGVSSGHLPIAQQFKLGGPFRLSAHAFNEMNGDHYLLGTIGYFRHIPRWSKRTDVYAVFWMESGGTFDSWSETRFTTDFSMGLYTSTLFGPLTIGCSFSEDSSQTLFMVLGKMF